MGKPIAIQVPSDDCVVTFEDGTSCTPHEGEWVRLVPMRLIGDQREALKIARLEVELEALKGETSTEAGLARIQILEQQFTGAMRVIAPRIQAWNWTDLYGEPLPLPKDDENVWDRLHQHELMYLYRIASGRQAPAAEKNA